MLIGTTHKDKGAELRAELCTATPAAQRGLMSGEAKVQVSAKSDEAERTGLRTEQELLQ